MNTKEVQEQITNLRAADMMAYKAGIKTSHVTSYVRNLLIKRAYEQAEDLSKEATVEMNMSVAGNIIGSLALLSRDGLYPTLFKKAKIELKNGQIFFSYAINVAGFSPEYKQKLNENLDIKLPLEV